MTINTIRFRTCLRCKKFTFQIHAFYTYRCGTNTIYRWICGGRVCCMIFKITRTYSSHIFSAQWMWQWAFRFHYNTYMRLPQHFNNISFYLILCQAIRNMWEVFLWCCFYFLIHEMYFYTDIVVIAAIIEQSDDCVLLKKYSIYYGYIYSTFPLTMAACLKYIFKLYVS